MISDKLINEKLISELTALMEWVQFYNGHFSKPPKTIPKDAVLFRLRLIKKKIRLAAYYKMSN